MKFNFKTIRTITHNDKKPTSKANHVGVEIEFYCWLDRPRLASELEKAGLSSRVKVGYDSSISIPSKQYDLGYQAHEVKIIDTERNIYNTIEKVCAVIAKWDGQVNSSCGLHVHLDMRNRDYRKCFHNLVNSQDLLFKLNPKHRRDNSFCVKNTSTDFDFVPTYKSLMCDRDMSDRTHMHSEACYIDVPDTSRRFAINKSAYFKYKTLEVRLHSGTVDPIKVNNWIKLLLGIIKKSIKIEDKINSLSSYKQTFKCEPELEKYIKSRLLKLSKKKNLVETY